MFNICFDGTAALFNRVELFFFPFSCLFVHHRHPNYRKQLWGASFYGIRSSCPQNQPTPWASGTQAMFYLLLTPRDLFVKDFVLNKRSNFPQTTLWNPGKGGGGEGGGREGGEKWNDCSRVSSFTFAQICVSMGITGVIHCPKFQVS